jgi:hypothetical protein
LCRYAADVKKHTHHRSIQLETVRATRWGCAS